MDALMSFANDMGQWSCSSASISPIPPPPNPLPLTGRWKIGDPVLSQLHLTALLQNWADAGMGSAEFPHCWQAELSSTDGRWAACPHAGTTLHSAWQEFGWVLSPAAGQAEEQGLVWGGAASATSNDTCVTAISHTVPRGNELCFKPLEVFLWGPSYSFFFPLLDFKCSFRHRNVWVFRQQNGIYVWHRLLYVSVKCRIQAIIFL